MKYYISIIILIAFFGCSSNKDKKQTFSNQTDSIKAPNKPDAVQDIDILVALKDTSHTDNDLTPRNEIFVTTLEKVYNDTALYVPMYYRQNWSESVSDEIRNAHGETVFNDGEQQRTVIDPKVAEKYLMTDGLDQLIVINDMQQIEDTLDLFRYEYFDAMIQTSLIATYYYKKINPNSIVISQDGYSSKNYDTSPYFSQDTAQIDKIAKWNGLKIKHIYFIESTQIGAENYTVLSCRDYWNDEESLYLLKNYKITDSVNKKYVLGSLQAVPLATDKKATYVAEMSIPETDIFWNQLTGIDFEKGKFIFYDRNRFPIEETSP